MAGGAGVSGVLLGGDGHVLEVDMVGAQHGECAKYS